MSDRGQEPLRRSLRGSFLSLRSRNVSRGAAFVFVVGLVAGYALVPDAAFAGKAKLTIQPTKSNDIIYIRGANFPTNGTATVQSTVGSGSQQHTARVHKGKFTLELRRQSFGSSGNEMRATAWSQGRKAVAKKSLQRSKHASPVEQFPATTSTVPPTTTTPPTTAPAPTTTPPTTAAPAPKPIATAAAGTTSGVPAGYKLAWSDEFNSFDGGKWGRYEGAGNAGIGTRSPAAVSVGGGELKITGNGMTGGGVGSNYKATYGYYEIRAKFDAGSIGYNTAALLWPTSERWPIDGEIDIAEIFNGNTKEAGSYVHWGANNSQLYNEYKGDFSQWHTWGVDWQKDRITYYLDGKPFWNVTQPAAIPHNPHFIGLQLDVTADGNKKNGSTYHVDYVRVYQKG